MMQASVFGALIAKPVNFPDELEFSLLPLRKHDESQIGGSFSLQDHHSWSWVQRRYPLNPEAESRIKSGEPIWIFVGTVTTNFPDGIEFPEGSAVEVIEN